MACAAALHAPRPPARAGSARRVYSAAPPRSCPASSSSSPAPAAFTPFFLPPARAPAPLALRLSARRRLAEELAAGWGTASQLQQRSSSSPPPPPQQPAFSYAHAVAAAGGARAPLRVLAAILDGLEDDDEPLRVPLGAAEKDGGSSGECAPEPWLVIRQGDIASSACDAVVTAANPALAGGGGVDGAVHRAAGPQLVDCCRRAFPWDPVTGQRCAPGCAVATPAFGALRCRTVVHAVGPVYRGGGVAAPEARVLASAFTAAVDAAASAGAATVALPAISCGVYGFPHAVASRVAVGALAAAAAAAAARGEGEAGWRGVRGAFGLPLRWWAQPPPPRRRFPRAVHVVLDRGAVRVWKAAALEGSPAWGRALAVSPAPPRHPEPPPRPPPPPPPPPPRPWPRAPGWGFGGWP